MIMPVMRTRWWWWFGWRSSYLPRIIWSAISKDSATWWLKWIKSSRSFFCTLSSSQSLLYSSQPNVSERLKECVIILSRHFLVRMIVRSCFIYITSFGNGFSASTFRRNIFLDPTFAAIFSGVADIVWSYTHSFMIDSLGYNYAVSTDELHR